MAAGSATIVRSIAHLAIDLGGDHHVLALDAEIDQRLPEQAFGFTGRIDVGGIDEIDAGSQRPFDDPVGRILADTGNAAPEGAFRRSEGHCSQADFRNEQAGIAKLIVTHG